MRTRSLFVALLALTLAVPAVEYHVAGPEGDDDADGTSPATAWATLHPAAERGLQAGDALLLRRGATIAGGVVIPVAGSAEAPVHIGAYGEGDPPQVTATHPPATCVIGIDGTHATIADLAIAGIPRSGLWISPASSDITVERCSFRELAHAIWTSGRGTRVLHCRFEDLVMVPDTPGDDDDAGAVAVAVNGIDTEVAWCEMRRCRAPSADYGHDGGAVEVWAELERPVRDLHVHHNRIHDCEGVLEIGGWQHPTVSGVMLERNVISGCGQMFMTLHRSGGTSAFGVDLGDLVLRHNTIVQSGSGWYGIWTSRPGEPLPLRLEHNLIVLHGARGLTNAGDVVLDGNLIHLAKGARIGIEDAGDTLLADPLLDDSLRPRPGSPAIDAAGTGTGLDPDRHPVPAGPAADIGAYEAPAP